MARRATMPEDGADTPPAPTDLGADAADVARTSATGTSADAGTAADAGTPAGASTADGGGGAAGTAPVRPPDAGVPDVVPRSARTLLWQARAGLAVGVLGVILALVFFLQSADLRAEAARRAQVLDAGEVVALRVTTFSGSDIDAWVADTQALATGDYAEEVATLFDPEIRQGLAEAQVESVGEVLQSFVQDVTGEDATVFAVMRQTYTSAVQPQPVADELRMEVRLRLVDDEWLASDVAVLGPSTITPVDPGAAPDGDPAGQGDGG